jgi:hypothetical protein
MTVFDILVSFIGLIFPGWRFRFFGFRDFRPQRMFLMQVCVLYRVAIRENRNIHCNCNFFNVKMFRLPAVTVRNLLPLLI